MGIDLTLMPVPYWDTKSTWWLCYNRLSFDRNYELFSFFADFGLSERIKEKKIIVNFPIPKDIRVDIYSDDGCKEEKRDSYGKPLTFFYAKEAKKIPLKEVKGEWNKAIIKFLQSIPQDTIIVMKWE